MLRDPSLSAIHRECKWQWKHNLLLSISWYMIINSACCSVFRIELQYIENVIYCKTCMECEENIPMRLYEYIMPIVATLFANGSRRSDNICHSQVHQRRIRKCVYSLRVLYMYVLYMHLYILMCCSNKIQVSSIIKIIT